MSDDNNNGCPGEATVAPAASSRRSAGIIATSLAFAMVQLDVTILNVALEEILHITSGNISELQWIVNGYTLAFAAFILTGGALGDRFGSKRVYLIGLTTFTTASLACGLAMSSEALTAARVLQGIGAAILIPCSLALLVQMYTNPKERARSIGIWGAAGGLAMALGPAIGGVIIHFAGWRAIFFINIPLALLQYI